MSVMRVGWKISHSKSLESLATVELPEEGKSVIPRVLKPLQPWSCQERKISHSKSLKTLATVELPGEV